jgi:hypothetical protein
MTSLDELRAELRAFVEARDWQQFHDPKNLAMLVASDLGDHPKPAMKDHLKTGHQM